MVFTCLMHLQLNDVFCKKTSSCNKLQSTFMSFYVCVCLSLEMFTFFLQIFFRHFRIFNWNSQCFLFCFFDQTFLERRMVQKYIFIRQILPCLLSEFLRHHDVRMIYVTYVFTDVCIEVHFPVINDIIYSFYINSISCFRILYFVTYSLKRWKKAKTKVFQHRCRFLSLFLLQYFDF